MPEAIWHLSGNGRKQHAVLSDTDPPGGGVLFFVLPFNLFVVMALASAASFYAHVYIDKEYHIEGSSLERFAWFRRKRQLHFAHHLHANRNFAVIDFFWGRMFGTYCEPDQDNH
jgi:sterol desaturase/sphingolipid hydroxylase (fatty acid hydroxylase superfamily)